MLSHNLPVKIEPQQNEVYNTKFKTSIVWKQLLKNPHIVDDSSWAVNTAYGTKTVADNKLTYTITTKNANQAITQYPVSFTQNHIYLLSCWLTVSEDQVVGIYTGNSVTNISNVKANVRTRIFNVFKSNVTSTRTCYIYPARNSGLPIGGTAILEDGCLYDLTEMFGEGKEMLGRFSFLSNFPNNYYDYNVDGNSVPFTIPVYGGSINIKTGLLQITKYNIDLGYLYWQYSAAQASTGKNRKTCAEVLFEPVASSSYADLISSGYKTETGNNVYSAMQGISVSTTGAIFIFDERYPLNNDMPAFANAVKGITACGVMASPVTYNLTPVEVKTLLGNNKISSNANELQLVYKNSQNENVSLTGSNEYTINDGVFDRAAVSATNLFSPKQNLNGWTYPYFSGLGPIKLDFEPIQGSVSGIDFDTSQRVYGDNFVLFDSHGNAPSTSATYVEVNIPVRNGNFYNQGKSTLSISMPTAHWPDRQVTLNNLMLYVKLLNEDMGIQAALFIFDLNELVSITETLSNDNKIAYVQITLYKKDTDTFLPVFLPLNIQYDYSDTPTAINYNVLPVPHYTNICPIEAYTESSVTVEGDRVPDSVVERRLKAITRPVFQWDFGLKLKFEGYTFADGTLCQFDNKITAYSLNAIIENNECTIPYQLLDENCQGDIIAYINVSGNDYDVVVYEVYIPVIKRPKPENLLRPAIDLPSAVIASFSDGADDVPLENLKIAVTPKQDLHGYDYPWIGGGGKNICPNIFTSQTIRDVVITVNNDGSIYCKGLASSDVYFNITNNEHPLKLKANKTYTFSGCPNGGSNEKYFTRLVSTPTGTVSLKTEYGSGASYSPSSDIDAGFRIVIKSGQDVDFTFYPMVEEGSSPTAYAPYSNICPITGYTEANVTRTGKNLCGALESGTFNNGKPEGSTYEQMKSNSASRIRVQDLIYIGGQTFTVSWGDYTTYAVCCTYFDANGLYLGNSTGFVNWKQASFSITNSSVYYIAIACKRTDEGTMTNTDISSIMLQLEAGSSATSYEPYVDEAYNTKFKTNVVWNQKLKDPHFELATSPKWRVSNHGTSSISGNKLTFTITTKNSNQAILQDSVSFVKDHVYLLSFWITVSEDQIVGTHTGSTVPSMGIVKANTRTHITGVFTSAVTSTRTNYIYVGRNNGIAVGGTAVLEDACLYDLTVMFGSGLEYLGRSSFFNNFSDNYYDYSEDGTSTPFTWTIYKATLDAKTGVLGITHSRYEFTGTEGWTLQSGTTTKYWSNAPDSGYIVKDAKLPTDNSHSVSIQTDIGDFNVAYNSLQNNQYSMCIASDSRFGIHATLYTGVGTLAGIGVIYELATPIFFKLTPTEVKTLLGYNNIWADTGEVKVSYYADPYLHFID